MIYSSEPLLHALPGDPQTSGFLKTKPLERSIVFLRFGHIVQKVFHFITLILNIGLACGLTLISISIVKTIIRQFCKRFLFVEHENAFICLVRFGSNFLRDALKRRSQKI